MLGEGLGHRVADGGDHGLGVAVGAARRLGHDLVDDAEPEQVLGGDLHVGRRVLGARGSRHRIEAAPSGEITE